MDRGARNDRLRRAVLENNVKLEVVNALSESVHIASRVIRSMLLLSDLETIKAQAPNGR